MSIYLSSKGRHEASDIEPLIVQPLKKLPSIGNTTPPRVVLSISHGVWGKHELKRVHQNLWVILTHQLAPHPLCKYGTLKPASSKGRVISEAMKATSSKP